MRRLWASSFLSLFFLNSTFLSQVQSWLPPRPQISTATRTSTVATSLQASTTKPWHWTDFEFAPNGVCVSPAYFVSDNNQQVFTLRNVPGEGDCMFQAVALASFASVGIGGNAALLRAITQELRHNTAHILASSIAPNNNGTDSLLVVTDQQMVSTARLLQQAVRMEANMATIDDYLTALRTPGHAGGLYGGGPELTVLSNLLRRPITIYELASDSENDDNGGTHNNNKDDWCHIVAQGTFGGSRFQDPLSNIPNAAVHSLSSQSQTPGAFSWHLHILVVPTGNGNEKHACVLLPQPSQEPERINDATATIATTRNNIPSPQRPGTGRTKSSSSSSSTQLYMFRPGSETFSETPDTAEKDVRIPPPVNMKSRTPRSTFPQSSSSTTFRREANMKIPFSTPVAPFNRKKRLLFSGITPSTSVNKQKNATLTVRPMQWRDVDDLVDICVQEYSSYSTQSSSSPTKRILEQCQTWWDTALLALYVRCSLVLKLWLEYPVLLPRNYDTTTADTDTFVPNDHVVLVASLQTKERTQEKESSPDDFTNQEQRQRLVGMIEISRQPPIPSRNPPAIPFPLWCKEVYGRLVLRGQQRKHSSTWAKDSDSDRGCDTASGYCQAWITNLLVIPTYRGQGWAKVLVQAAETVATQYWRQPQPSSIHLHCDASFRVAQNLYLSMGYQATPPEAAVYFIDGVPLLYLTKRL